jgi:hypothetical protein
VTIKAIAAWPGYAAWLNPSRVALLGTVVVALMLTLPVRVPAPGDHETMSCGNALKLDIGRAQDYADDYWAQTNRVCTNHRITRVAQAVGVVSVTILIATLMTARMRGRSSSGEPRPQPRLGQAQPDDL